MELLLLLKIMEPPEQTAQLALREETARVQQRMEQTDKRKDRQKKK